MICVGSFLKGLFHLDMQVTQRTTVLRQYFTMVSKSSYLCPSHGVVKPQIFVIVTYGHEV